MLLTMMPDDRFVPPLFLKAKGWMLALAAGFGVCVLSAANFGFWHWNLAAGLVFALLWLSPVRTWLWIAVGAGALAMAYVQWLDPAEADAGAAALLGERQPSAWEQAWLHLLAHWADWLLCLMPVLWLRQRIRSASALLSTEGTALLHVGALMAAVLMTATDVLFVLTEGFVADSRRGVIVNAVAITPDNALLLLGTFAVKNGLGYFLGIMLVAPVLFWWTQAEFRLSSRPVLRDAILWLGPVVLGFIALTQIFPGSKLAELLRLLLLAAVIVFAVRHGWRGAAFSVLVVSVAIGVEDHLGAAPQSPVLLQTFVAIAGAMALMFGATVDQLRQRSAELLATREQELQAAAALAEAAARNVRVEEAERGRIAMELHDSLGQGITALQTQIKLVELDAGDAAKAWTSGLREVVDGMRDGVRDVLEALRPSALRELGLVKSIDLGAMRQMVERAGVRFETKFLSPPGGLESIDDATAVAVYRIVQEAVTNALRHGRPKTIRLRIRFGFFNAAAWVIVAVDDDGVGMGSTARLGRGLQGMRDRALTLGGDLHTRSSRLGGLSLRAWLRASAG